MKFTKCVRPEKERKENIMKTKGILRQFKNMLKKKLLDKSRSFNESSPWVIWSRNCELTLSSHSKKVATENFPGQLLFLAPKPTKTEVIINISTISAQHVTVDWQIHIKNVADQLRDDTISYIKNCLTIGHQ